MSQTHDGMCLAAISKAPGSRVSWFLMASCLYYHADVSLISDGLYDRLAKDLHEDYDRLEHPHAHLFTRDDLAAGTLFALPMERYPLMTRCAASTLAAHALSRDLWDKLRADYAAPAPAVRQRTRVHRPTPAALPAAPVIRTRVRTPAPPPPRTVEEDLAAVPRIRTRTRTR